MPCPICGKPLKTWYALGGLEFKGCEDIKCNYKKEVEEIVWEI